MALLYTLFLFLICTLPLFQVGETKLQCRKLKLKGKLQRLSKMTKMCQMYCNCDFFDKIVFHVREFSVECTAYKGELLPNLILIKETFTG